MNHILSFLLLLLVFSLQTTGGISSSKIDDSKHGIEDPLKKTARSNKNPDVDTSFLPDRDREEEENRLREELRLVTVV